MPETIAAVATGGQLSAIGIVRLSGDDAITIIDRVFRPLSKKAMSSYPDRKLVYGDLLDNKGRVLDICLCTISRAPMSYTGENTAELQCHGSPVVLREAMEALFASGARQAKAGEFTKRAFLNGRMDLTAAEAVIDLISAETAEAARNAAGQLGGAIFRKIEEIYNNIIEISSHYHAVLDYPDEEIEPFELKGYADTLFLAQTELERLSNSFNRGRVMQSGIKTAIVGRPNAGKSSLLNVLLGYERAIVTEIPGTTRDTIEGKVVLGGILLRLVDTAGLRGTTDPIEKLGVDRAKAAASDSELVLAVFDGSEQLANEDLEAISAARTAVHSIAIINKADLTQRIDKARIEEYFDLVCSVSALEKTGIEALEGALRGLFPLPGESETAGEILTNARQADAVGRALSSVKAAREAIDNGLTPDAVLTETEDAVEALGQLAGRNLREDITTRIFERFCVGK